MEGFKEFQGKDLDGAIEEACGYFNTAREKLEIEILQDAKSGIFGIVGARKAKVRARRAHLREAVESILGKKGGAAARDGEENAARAAASSALAATDKNARQEQPKNGRERNQERGRKSGAATPVPASMEAAACVCAAQAAGNGEAAPGAAAADNSCATGMAAAAPQPEASDAVEFPVREKSRSEGRREPCRASGRGRPRREESRAPAQDGAPVAGLDSGEDLDEAGEGLPVTPVEQLDAARLETLTQKAVRELVRPIVGTEVRLEVALGGGRVQVCVDCDEDSGLLIGREGQTLAALQYLVSRVVSRGMNSAVRVQLDAGEYRQRQDEKLREMALALADKVRQSGRSYSTRPLSSYHRRIVHVCLQDAADVQTRSTGDGPMKRVVIMRRKAEKN